MIDISDLFTANLKHLRRSKGLTQEGLANLSGYSRVYIASMEAGAVSINLKTIGRIARGLRVPPWRLLWTKDR